MFICIRVVESIQGTKVSIVNLLDFDNPQLYVLIGLGAFVPCIAQIITIKSRL